MGQPTECCIECFVNPWLRDFVSENSHRVGACPFCDSEKAQLIKLSVLAEPFSNLFVLYEPATSDHLHDYEEAVEVGELLSDLIEEKWQILSERHEYDPTIPNQRWTAQELVGALYYESVPAHGGYYSEDPEHELFTTRPSKWHATQAEMWSEFCRDVQASPDRPLPLHEAFDEDVRRSVETVSAGTKLFRARPGCEGEGELFSPFRGQKIGAPPAEKAAAGRANSQGERVLYAATEERTAVAEIRPASGQYVSVCSLSVRTECTAIRLTHDLSLELNPFLQEGLRYWSEHFDLLGSFASRLSTPLRRTDDTHDYIPSQRLASHLFELGIDAIFYPSSLDRGGVNVVFCDPDVCEVGDSKLVEITDIEISYNTTIFK